MDKRHEYIIDSLLHGVVTGAHSIGATNEPCGKCGGDFRVIASVLPGPPGLFDSTLYHEGCHPTFGSHPNPAKAMRDALT